MELTKDALKVLQEIHFEAYLCTATKDGQPSARLVGAIPSPDLTQICVGNTRFNKAARDLSENKKAMLVFHDSCRDIFGMKGFQVECEVAEEIRDKEHPIFKASYNGCKEAINKDEADLLKSVYIFNIKRIYDCSMEGGGKVIS